MLRLATLVLLCLGLHLLAAPLPRSAKKGEPIVLPAKLSELLDNKTTHIKAYCEVHTRAVAAGNGPIGVSEKDMRRNLIRSSLRGRVRLLQRARNENAGISTPGTDGILEPLRLPAFTPEERLGIDRAIDIYEKRLRCAEKTGDWKWSDLDIPSSTADR